MSRESRRRREEQKLLQAPEELPGEPDWTDEVAAIVWAYEKSWDERVNSYYAKNRALGLYSQARIYQLMDFDEMQRRDPEGKLAVENGDTLPSRNNKTVNWGDI